MNDRNIKKSLWLIVFGAIVSISSCQRQINEKSKMKNQETNKTNLSGKAYLVVNARLNTENQDAIKAYTENVVPLLKKAGGKNLVRARFSSAIKGESKYPLLLFMEFESDSAIKEAFSSKDYEELIPFREKAFLELDIYTFVDL